jgi:signal transduction histidine kinase
MFERLRRSLALRLAGLYALVFALAAGLLFTALYWVLANALEAREQAAVERLAGRLTGIYEEGGALALRAEINSNTSPEVRSFFVRVVSPGNETIFASVPPDWVQTQVLSIPIPGGLGLEARRQIRTVRVPQNALRDYAIASAELADGSVLQVGRSTDSRAVLLKPFRTAFAWVGAAALALSLFVGTLLAWRATRPLRLVSDTARRILETGDLSARVADPRGSDELALLVRQFNTLLERNSAHLQVLRDTLDSLAHDLRTPLTRLRGTAELALHDGQDPKEAKDALADCIDETDRLLHVINSLLDISAAEGGALRLNRSQVDLRGLAERAADLYREVAEEKRIEVRLELQAPVLVEADAVRLGQAANNLLDNALKYTPAGGHVVLSTGADPSWAVLSVRDDGPGVPAAEREAIFRRLYRGDASRSERGLGLGLSLVKAVVESHGGTVAVGDAPGGGACFTIRLPLSRAP